MPMLSRETHARTRRRAAVILVCSLSMVFLSTAKLAYAAPPELPATDALFTIECDDAKGTVPPLQLFRINPLSAVLSAVGNGDPTVIDSNCAGPTASVDPSTNLVYFIDQTRDNPSLTRINATTGVSTVIAEFRLAGDPLSTYDPNALTIDPFGNAFVVNQGELASVDLATGLVTPIGDGDSGSLSNIYAIVSHPSTGIIYGISSSGPGQLYTYDPDTGEATLITAISQTGIYGAAFDSSGTLWVTNSASGGIELASVDVTNWATSYAAVGTLTLATNPTYSGFYTQSLFLTSDAWPDVSGPDDQDGGSGGGGDTGSDELARTGPPSAVTSLVTLSLATMLLGGVVLVTRQKALTVRG